MQYIINPIGALRKDNKTILEIYSNYVGGLDGLKEGQRIMLFLWFHKSEDKREILKVHSHGEPGYPLRGVFTTRSPVRPNPIALYNVKIHKIMGNIIVIDDIDAYDGTPIVDIKPFVRNLDCKE
jgi:tRNA-Thr(GGU) m(6)t(6)A37 methyltransferase TsaA